MLDRRTGKVLHIDFGDCFEVAMTRDKFPERVPFRLTRMLINAMEVAGIEGAFRTTAEAVMRVLRANRDSVMAMLEAFVHDPLINWRLLGEGEGNADEKEAQQDETATGADMIRREAAMASLSAAGYSTDGLTKVQSESVFSLAQSVHVSRGAIERALARALGPEGVQAPAEELNTRAVAVTSRVAAKLTGRDFGPVTQLNVQEQVQRCIEQATSHIRLSQAYAGWCATW
jgi:FKBP12-rapamycin complex-associated protein